MTKKILVSNSVMNTERKERAHSVRKMILLAALGFFFLQIIADQAWSSPRVALVIGNAQYRHAPGLANPLNDATDIGAAFERLGFAVTLVANSDSDSLRRTLRDFKRAASASAVIFYASHGIVIDNRNILAPVDAKLASDEDVEYETVPLELVSGTVKGASELRLVILDACRDYPFIASMRRAGATRSIGRGRGRIEPPGETLVAYAAKVGTVAQDGEGRNSPFTKALLAHVEQPGLEVGLMFRQMRDAVLAQTGGRQDPFVYGSLSAKGAYLNSPPDRQESVPAQAPPAIAVSERDQTNKEHEAVFWNSIKDSDSADEYKAYLETYPEDSFAALAATGKEAVLELAKKAEEERQKSRMAAEQEFRDCTDCPLMVVIPGGAFTMGSPASEEDRRSAEGPQHRVTISNSFAVGKFEVTFNEWDACVNDSGCSGHSPSDRGWGRGNRPVINVSWDEAKTYVAWLSRKTGHQYRLLSESEWEYVARAGTTGPFHFGSTISTDQANYNGDYFYGSGRKGVDRQKTLPVGSFPSNAFGVHDVHGNVFEWVEDCWHDSYAGAPGDGRAWTWGGSCAKRVLRGGSWNKKPWDLRAAIRFWNLAVVRFFDIGFRVARTLTP